MPVYYIITNISDNGDGNAIRYDTLAEALIGYREALSYTDNPILAQRLEVSLVATDLDGKRSSITRE